MPNIETPRRLAWRHTDASATPAPSRLTRTTPWLFAAWAAIVWAALTMLILHLISSHNPILDTISSYAVTDNGTGMLGASVLALSIGSFAVLGALHTAGVPISRVTAGLVGIWSIGLAIAAMFPADLGQTADPTSGRIHQYACLVALVSLPIAGLVVTERLRARPGFAAIRRTVLSACAVATIALALFGLSYGLGLFPRTPILVELATLLPVGLTQRIALVADAGLLLVLAGLARRTAQRAVSAHDHQR